jgi:hypothetical protein
MSKFWFFDRKGRPTSNEKRICDTFNSFIDGGSVSKNQVEEYLEEYGKPMNESELEEMFGFLTGNDSNGNKYQYADDEDFDNGSDDEDFDDNSVDFEEVNTKQNSSNNSIEFNPFEEPVIERAYTKGFQPKSKGEDDDSDSDEDDDSDDDNGKGFSNEDLKMPNDGESIEDFEQDEDIPEPEWASTGGFGSNSEEEEEEDYDDDEDGGEKLGGDNLQDLTPAQKRKSAEKTAEALLSMYCQFVPMPFIKWSSFSEGKLQKMVFENKLDLTMQLENNVSVKDYIDGVNEQAQEVFKVSDETKEEIKDPLIDVLLEQDLALTPTQRLMLAVGGHLVTMGFSAFQLAQNNKQALETFEKFHIQMNKQQAPIYQQQEKQSRTSRPRPQDNLSKVEKDSVEELMRQMVDNESEDDDDDIIDSENDPSVEVSVDYGDDD